MSEHGPYTICRIGTRWSALGPSRDELRLAGNQSVGVGAYIDDLNTAYLAGLAAGRAEVITPPAPTESESVRELMARVAKLEARGVMPEFINGERADTPAIYSGPTTDWQRRAEIAEAQVLACSLLTGPAEGPDFPLACRIVAAMNAAREKAGGG